MKGALILDKPSKSASLLILALLLASAILVLPAFSTQAKASTYVAPSITLSSSSGPSGSYITVSGQNFGDEDDLFEISMCCSHLGSVSVSSAPYYCIPNGAGSFSCEYPILQTNSEYFCLVPTVLKQIECLINAAKGALPYPPGQYTIEVQGEISIGIKTLPTLETVSLPFTVSGIGLTLSTDTASWGSTISVSGTGFAPSDSYAAVTVQSLDSNTYFDLFAPCTFGGSCFAETTPDYVSSTLAICSMTGGSFSSCSITIPSGIQPTLYYVNATGSNQCGGCDSGLSLFTLEPSVTLTPSSGPAGTNVKVTGSGWGGVQLGTNKAYSDTGAVGSYGTDYPYDSIIMFGENNCPVNNFQLSSACSFTVPSPDWLLSPCPSGPGGTSICTLTVCGSTGLDCGSATFIETPPMGISISPGSDPIGESVTITGQGFSLSDSHASVTMGGTTVVSSCAVTAGEFSCPFTVPAGIPTGQYAKVIATGNSGDSVTSYYYVSQPAFFPFTTSGIPGSTAGFAYFVGYSPHDTALTVTLNGVNVTPTGGCPNKYSYECTITVPNTMQAGSYPLTITGNTGDSSSTQFTILPSVSVSPSLGLAATTVAVEGIGFSSSDTSVTLTLGATNVTPTIGCPVSLAGTMFCTFSTPPIAGGEYTLTAKGNSGDSASTTYTVLDPVITLTPSSGSGGIAVTVTGGQFDPSDLYAVISFGGDQVVTCVVADGVLKGIEGDPFSTTCSFAVPSSGVGTPTVTARGSLGDTGSAIFRLDSIFFYAGSGPVGTDTGIVVNGLSKSASSATLSFNGQNVTPNGGCPISGNGQLQCGFTVPNFPDGPYVLTMTDNVGDMAEGTFTVTTKLVTLSTDYGPTGTVVTVTGSGFRSDDGILPYNIEFFPPFGLGVSIGSCNGGGGGFTCQVTIPSTVYSSEVGPGSYSIAVTGYNDEFNDPEVVLPFSVTVPTVSLSLTSGPAGTLVTATGSGYSLLDTSASLALSTTDVTPSAGCPMSGGDFTCQFLVPNLSPSLYSLTATGSTGDKTTAGYAVTVPSISVLPANANPGASVVIAGSGFIQSDVLVDLVVSGMDVTPSSGCAASEGSFSCAVNVPSSLSPGTYAVSAKGSGSDTASTNVLVFSPGLSESPASGIAGSVVTLTGSGYSGADTTASISFGDIAVTPLGVCAVTVSKTGGSFECSVTVPAGLLGPQTVTATGSSGDSGSVSFTVFPSIAATPSTGSVGGTITLSGTGFASTDSSVSLTFGGVAMVPSTCPVSDSSFSCSFVVPAIASGAYMITATGAALLDDSASTVFTVNDESLSLTQTSGPLGTVVGVLGSGFPASPSYVSMDLGTAPVVPLTTTGTSTCQIAGAGNENFGLEVESPGSLSCVFTVPNLAPGAYTLTVNDPGQGTASTTFTVTDPSIAMMLSPTSGPAGAALSVSAAGFPSTDTSANVAFGSSSLGGCPVSGGTATCTVTVPSVSPGDYTVTATDSFGDAGSSMFTVTQAAINAVPSSGPAGTVLAVGGSGFSSSDTMVAISFDGQTLTSSTEVCTPSGGYFLCGVQVPSGSAGTYSITAAGGDGSGDSASTPFTITVPTISVFPGSGPAGSGVTITGSGFPSQPSYATVSLGTTSLVSLAGSGTSSCPIASDGSVSCSATIPPVTAGPYSLTVSDLFGDSASAQFTVTFPTISLSPTAGGPGSQTTVYGSGFSPADTMASISFGGSIVALSCPVSTGSFTCLITVPALATLGSNTVTATGTGGDSASATFEDESPTAVSTSLSSTTISAGQSVADTATLTVGSAPTGTVSFYYSTTDSCPETGAILAGLGAVPLAGGSATSAPVAFPAPGTYYWYAVYSGDSNDLGSTSRCEPLVVQATGMAVTAYSVTGAVDVGGTVSVSASIQNTGHVALSSLVASDAQAGPLACLSYSLAQGASTTCTGTFTAPSSAGTVFDSLSASATDSNGVGLSASSGTSSIKVQDFALVATPTNVGVIAGKTGTSQISLNNLDGFSGVVALSTSSVPSGITASLSSASIGGTSTSTLTVGSQAAGTYTLTVTGTSGAVAHTIVVTISVGYANCAQVPNKGGANLKGANLDYCNLAGYDMSGDNLMGASMSYTNLQGTNLQGANLKGVDLIGTDANGADFQGANLMAAVLTDATALGANFQGANLMGDTLHGGDFMDANFQGANMRTTDLSYGNFSNANFQGVNLMNSDMSYGDFDYVNFTGANTNGVNTTGATFTGAVNPP